MQKIFSTESLLRRLNLEGSYNLRDVGGYPTLDGYYTNWQTLLRADDLSCLPNKSQQALLDYGVKTILDIRSPLEVKQIPSVFSKSESVIYKNLPVFTEIELPIFTQAKTLAEMYCLILEQCQDRIKLILEAIAASSSFPLVIHCTGGKDRTGLIIALMLSIANVSVTAIVEDYILSEQYLSPLHGKWRQEAKQAGHDLERFEKLLESKAETIIDTLNYLANHYDGATGYLRAIGITDEQIQHLRTLLVKVNF